MKVNYKNGLISLGLVIVSVMLIQAAGINNLLVNFAVGVVIGLAFPLFEAK